MSAFAVKNSDAESISSEKIRTWLSSAPASSSPLRSATVEAPAYPIQEHIQGVHVVEVVVHGLDGLASGHAVDEFERPKPGLELLRGRDRAERLAGNGHLVNFRWVAARDARPSANYGSEAWVSRM